MSAAPIPPLSTQVEAILYLKGQPMTVAAIAECAGCKRAQAQKAVQKLIQDYAQRDGALEIVETPSGYSLQLRQGLQHLMQNLVPAELGIGALRTLVVIALKGPLVQTELIDLRGSSAYQQVQELVNQGFVRKRRQTEGRSFLLEVTPKFHQYFEVDELSKIMEQYRSESPVEAAERSEPTQLEIPHPEANASPPPSA